MKTIFSLFLFGAFISPAVLAQNNLSKDVSSEPSFSVDAVNPPVGLSGKTNYMLSLSDKDFNNKVYVFYTDSNATVAHIRINGNDTRLTGGPNPENIMAYTCKGYTITLSENKKPTSDVNITTGTNQQKMEATLVIYTGTETVGKKVCGVKINDAKN
jgi:hypothetical protein